MILFLSFAKSKAQKTYDAANQDSVLLAYAKNAAEIDTAIMSGYETDNTVYPKKFKKNFVNNYKSNEFNYTTTQPKTSLWEKFLERLKEWLRNIFGKVDDNKAYSYTSIFIRILLFVVVGFILYIIISYIISKEGNFIWSKKNKNINIETENVVENIHEIHFSEKILEFENTKNYRSAIRYQFLNVLKIFSDQKRIDWNTEKTNHDYLNELKDENLKSKFSELIYIFEYVWYGEFTIDEEAYQHLKRKFEV